MKNIRHIFLTSIIHFGITAKCSSYLRRIVPKKRNFRKYNILFHEFHAKYDEINEDLWVKIRDGIIDKDFLRKT